MRAGRDSTLFTLTLGLAACAGIFLRLYLLKDEVFADDEWHGLYYVIGKSPFWLLTHFSIPGATCIPLNVYTWLLGQTVGWSEIWLRMPSLICGILCVLTGPLLAREIVGTRRAAWLALLLAISPLLIFYSRISRPYSAVAFLSFAALLFAARWARRGGRRLGIIFVVLSVLAVYFHLFAIVTAMAPVLAAMVYLVVMRLRKQPATLVAPPLRQWIFAAVAMAGLSVLLLSAPMLHSLRSTFFTIALKGSFALESLPRVAMLMAGTGQPVLMALFWAAFLAGAIEQCRRNPWFGGMLLSLFPLHVIALLISRPDSAQSAIVLVRYSIPLVPVTLLFVACGMESALEAIARAVTFRPLLQTLTVFACAGALLLAGPLPQCYISPNNFTSHGAYQYQYGRIDWSHSFYSDLTPPDFKIDTVISADEVSPFYKMLGQHPDGRPIVEYPMMIGDHFDPFYYYQHFHHRPVLVGYASDVQLPQGLASGNIYGDTYIDQVLSLIHDPSRIRFRNFVSMDNLPAMRTRGVEYIILHKRFESQLYEVAMPLPDLDRLYQEYRKSLGPPVYEDAQIAVFGVSAAAVTR